ncbi:MAG: DUF2892 domain-containing protein [Rhodospirillales bacterium]|nr:DUF2892 domain-containing protein [Rhodospirillales bacterium]
MTANVGGVDRILRIIVGIALIAFAVFSQHEYAVWGWVGIVPLATGIIRWCPAYLPLGIKTCKTD